MHLGNFINIFGENKIENRVLGIRELARWIRKKYGIIVLLLRLFPFESELAFRKNVSTNPAVLVPWPR